MNYFSKTSFVMMTIAAKTIQFASLSNVSPKASPLPLVFKTSTTVVVAQVSHVHLHADSSLNIKEGLTQKNIKED